MELNLNETIKTLLINGMEFVCDTTDLSSIRALINFDDKYKNIRELDSEFLSACEDTVDIVLGKGAYSKLFKKDSLKPYYLIQKLKEIFYSDIEKYASENTTKEMEEIKDILNTVNAMTDTMDKLSTYADKYDIH